MSRTRLNHIAPLMGNPADYTAQLAGRLDPVTPKELADYRRRLAAMEGAVQETIKALAANPHDMNAPVSLASRLAAIHATPPVEPHHRPEPTPHIETEADAFEPACVPWDGDDDGRDL